MYKLVRRVRLSVSVSALIALAVGLGLTCLLFASVRRVESQLHAAQFEQEARLRSAAVTDGLGDAVERLVILSDVFKTVGVLSREQFRAFTQPLLQRYPEVQALSFQRLVQDADRERYEAGMRRLFPDFAITELADGGGQRKAARRDSYNVVDYIEPLAGNQAALGLDTAVSDDQLLARQRSRDSGRVAATGLLSLVQHQGWHTGFLLVTPVFLRGAPVDTPALRRRAVIGEIAAVFRVDHLINTFLSAAAFRVTPGMTINIYASATPDPTMLAYRRGPPTAAVPDPWLVPRWLLYDIVPPVITTFSVAGNPWHIEVTQAPVPFTAHHGGSLLALLGGVLLSLLAAAYIYTLVSRKTTIERATALRTAALSSANARLTEDLALRLKNERSLRLRERAIEVSSNAIIICNARAPDYAIEYVNPAFESITGYSADEVVGRSLESMQGASKDQQNLDEIRAALREQRAGRAMLRNYRKDGSGYWNDLVIAPVQGEDGTITHFVVAQYDITAVMGYEAELEFQARHDALTGLANRTLLHERLGKAIAAAAPDSAPLWVAFVDIDRFKFINDTLGHDAGDVLLKTLAVRLQAVLSQGDTVARVGGDEFVLVLPERDGPAAVMATLQRIMDAVALPLLIEDHEFFLTCSIGVASHPGDGSTAEALTRHADIAMYRAKELGRNNTQFYTAAMNERTLDRLHLESDLRHALERGQFLLHYQPQVNLRTGAIVGMEALLRWEHPVHGLIAPVRFMDLAEEMGLIIPIGAWVLQTACVQTRAWQQAGLADLRVAVNLSARQFTQKGLLQSITDVLNTSGLEPRFLELELTETMVMSDVDNAITILRKLKTLGIHIAIDDFGTGYSSLSYLRRFPIDVLKIDQSFVSEITNNADDASIVATIISLAHSLRLDVIAEGVETEEQLGFLARHGCDQMQGYYFSRPVTAAGFEVLLCEKQRLQSLMTA